MTFKPAIEQEFVAVKESAFAHAHILNTVTWEIIPLENFRLHMMKRRRVAPLYYSAN